MRSRISKMVKSKWGVDGLRYFRAISKRLLSVKRQLRHYEQLLADNERPLAKRNAFSRWLRRLKYGLVIDRLRKEERRLTVEQKLMVNPGKAAEFLAERPVLRKVVGLRASTT